MLWPDKVKAFRGRDCSFQDKMKKKAEAKAQPKTATAPGQRWLVGQWIGNDGSFEQLSFDNNSNGFFLKSNLFQRTEPVTLRTAVHWWGMHSELDGRFGSMEWERGTSDLFFHVANALKK
jgi:hypothetical protein